MKVGIVHTAYLQRGGEDIAVEQESNCLKNDCEVSVLLFNNPASSWRRMVSFGLALFNPGSLKRMDRWIQEERPDIIHVHNWYFGASPSILRAARKRGIPVVHTLHNFRLLCPTATLLHNNRLFLNSLNAGFPWQAVFRKVYHDSFFQTFWLSFVLWWHRACGTWKGIDRYIVLTEHAKGLFLSSKLGLRQEQVSVKPNFTVDVPGQKVGSRQDHFLFIGRLSEEKGVEMLLAAFAGSPFQLTIIGDGPLRPLVVEQARLHPNIGYEGFRDRAFILQELARCTAMIFSSIWYEGNPITIIEAFACGTPVIASRMGAMTSMIRDGVNGLHFEPGDSQDLRLKLRQWQDMDPSARDNYYQQARQTYEECYTPEKNMQQLLSIYKGVLENNSSINLSTWKR